MRNNLVGMIVRPAETIQRILAQPRDRMIIPLVILATISGSLSEVSFRDLRGQIPTDPRVLAIVLCVWLAALAATVLCFYLIAWVMKMVGRIFDGQATARALRPAIAWALVPVVLALAFRVPFVFAPRSVLVTVVLAILNVAILIWTVALMSITVGEAHEFSPWTGLGTVLLSALAPVVVIAAFALTMWIKH